MWRAHKHVPMLETHVGEAVKNNVFEHSHIGRSGRRIRHRSLCLHLDRQSREPIEHHGRDQAFGRAIRLALSGRSTTRFMAVRFGNVLGSAGSVVPIFYNQIRQGGPITITHPEIKRFFMTIPRGRATGAASRGAGPGRTDIRARHGRADLHRRSGEADDSQRRSARTRDRPGVWPRMWAEFRNCSMKQRPDSAGRRHRTRPGNSTSH